MWRLTLITLLFSFSAFAQSDTNKRQIEFASAIYPARYSFVLHASMGVNFHAKKERWYNNVMLASTVQDYTVKSGGSLVHFYTFSIGKNYQFTKKHFYFSTGINTGIYYTDWKNDNLSTRNYGICFVPRLEIGWNMKKVILSIGEYFPIGWGVYQKYIDGEVYYSNPDKFEILDRTHGGSISTLYLRLVLK